jgi:hypothetical protein
LPYHKSRRTYPRATDLSYPSPDLRMLFHHPLFRARRAHYYPLTERTLFRILRSEANRFRRLRRDEHPDDYEVAFLTSLFRALDRQRREDIEFEDWFEEQPLLTRNSMRERSRLTAAGVEKDRLPPVYRPPSEGRTECEGQRDLAL